MPKYARSTRDRHNYNIIIILINKKLKINYIFLNKILIFFIYIIKFKYIFYKTNNKF